MTNTEWGGEPINPLQQHEWMLRIPLCNMQTGQVLLRRIPDPMPGDESDLLDALHAMDSAIHNIKEWARKNGVVIKESMHT